MSKILKRYWYLRQPENEREVCHLCQAENTATARGIFGSIAEGHDVIRLTWNSLHNLIGCLIPSTCKSDAPAQGNIMIKHYANLCMIWDVGITGD